MQRHPRQQSELGRDLRRAGVDQKQARKQVASWRRETASVATPALGLFACRDPQLAWITGMGVGQRLVHGGGSRIEANKPEAGCLRFGRETGRCRQRSEFAAAVAALSNGAGNTQKNSTTTLASPSTTLSVNGIGS